jgi:pimeloyl-ACP methyl ester carboxylesterase
MKPIHLILSLLLACCSMLPQEEQYVDIEGQKFRVKIFGEGEPTVIFECGMSDSLEQFKSIPDSVATFARVFLYDRADIGKSDTSRQPRTIPNMVSELRMILAHEKIEPPYVFVVHSMGGFIARYFIDKYPGEVTGLLLLDPSPETFWEEMPGDEFNEWVEGGNEHYHTKFPPSYWKEWYQFVPNMEYMKGLTIPDGLPVILVSCTEWSWYEWHARIIEGLDNARHIELEGDHYVHQKYPDLMVGYIRELTGN